MSYMDDIFVRNCESILRHGSTDEDLAVRPHWQDGTPAHTSMIFNQCNTYQLTKHSIPVLTLRKINFKACVDEILWIYQKTSNRVADLNSHIWDAWADENNTIGKAYGYQIAQRYRHHIYTPGEDLTDYPSASVYGKDFQELILGYHSDIPDNTKWVYMNQIDAVIWSLRNNPADRGIITNMYNHQDLADMGLRPCAYSLTFNVENRNDKKYLHMLLNQRSQDMIVANGWNITQYAVLQQMIAQVCDMLPGSLTHMVANMHIYDRHRGLAQKMITDWECNRSYANPEFWINPEIKRFRDFTVDDVKLIDYKYIDRDDKIEVAI